MVLISVIIPIYNVEKYLERCIVSLVKQEYFNDIEVILVNDGSTDNSWKICDKYEEKYENLKVINKRNGGLSDARNTGLKYATGQYIFFLDSDDMVLDSFIKDMENIITRYEPDMICFKYTFEKENNIFKPYGNKKITQQTVNETIDDLLKVKMGNQICFNVYKKKLFEDVVFPLNRAYEDIATLYKLILKSKRIVKTQYSYYVYNITNVSSITQNSTLKNINDMYLSVNEQISDLEYYFNNNGISKRYLRYYKLDKYIYIYIKLKREVKKSHQSEQLLKEVEENILRDCRVNIDFIKYYNVKKYLYFIVTHIKK